MKALMLKNFYELKHRTTLILIIISLLAALPASNMSAFAILWVALLPVTVSAYDEQSKWTRLEKMMPYSSLEIVLSKYFTAYLGIAAITLISIISRIICKAAGLTGNLYSFEITPVVLLALMGTVMLSVSFPIILKFGVEKGRWINILFVMIIAVVGSALSGFLESDTNFIKIKSADSTILISTAILTAVLVNLISIKISANIQKNKNK